MNDLATRFKKHRMWIFIGFPLLLVALFLLVKPRHEKGENLNRTVEKDQKVSSPSSSIKSSNKIQEDQTYVESETVALAENEFDSSFPSEKAYLAIQSPARPAGLDVVDEVQMGGSDPRSKDFLDRSLPGIIDFIESNKTNGNLQISAAPDTDAAYLTLPDPTDLRVYFVADNGDYHNSIGMFSGDDPNAALLFPDASSTYSAGQGTSDTSERFPVLPGDFIDVGATEAGSYLDLFIIPNGASGGSSEAYVTDQTLNADQTSHMKVLGVANGSMLVIGFEDMANGGDGDYNDVIIAVDVGEQNGEAISGELNM